MAWHKDKEDPLQGDIDQKTGVVEDLKREIQDLLKERSKIQADVLVLADAKKSIEAQSKIITADAQNKASIVSKEASDKLLLSEQKLKEVEALHIQNTQIVDDKLATIGKLKIRHEGNIASLKKYEEEVANSDKKLKEREQSVIIRCQNVENSEKIVSAKKESFITIEKTLIGEGEKLAEGFKRLENEKIELENSKKMHAESLKAFQVERDKLLEDRKDLFNREELVKTHVTYVDNRKNELQELEINTNRAVIDSKAYVDNYRRIKQETEQKITELENHKKELRQMIEDYNASQKTEVK